MSPDRPAVPLPGVDNGTESILDGLMAAVWILDVDGALTHANSAARELSGIGDRRRTPMLGDAPWWGDDATRTLIETAIESARGGGRTRFEAEIAPAGAARGVVDMNVEAVRIGDEVVGIVASGTDVSERRRAEAEVASLASLESLERRRVEALFALAQALATATTVDEVAEQVVALGGVVVGASVTSLGRADADAREVLVHDGPSRSSGREPRWTRIPLDRSTPIGLVLLTHAAVHLATPEEIRDRFPGSPAPMGLVDSAAVAAHPAADAAVGFGWDSPMVFTPSLCNSLALVAALSGQALGRVASQERDRRVADRLQRALRPRSLPDIPGVDTAVRYEAGSDGLRVGGDWFDLGLLDDRRYVIGIGDVVGHGLESAAAMGRLRSAFAALASNAFVLERLVERLDHFTSEMTDARYSTMLALEYRLDDRRLNLVSAGHPPPIVRRADGEVAPLGEPGPPLGFEREVRRQVQTTTLNEGDVLVCYTDGLVERRGENIDVGLSRLRAAVAAAPTTSAQAINDAIFSAAEPSGDDDIALLVVKV